MSFKKRVNFEAVRELAFGGISGTYANLGAVLTEPGRLVTFYNTTDADIYVSFDASTDQIRVATNSFRVLDFTANKNREDGLFLAVGTQISVKQVSGAPTSGDFWAEVMFADGGS